MNQNNCGRTNGSEERLSRFLDGELPREDARYVERLLETSGEACEVYATLTRLHALCLEAFPRTHFRRPLVQVQRRWRLARLAAAAVLAVVFGGLGWAAVRTWIAPSSPPGSSTATPESNGAAEVTGTEQASSQAGATSTPQSLTTDVPGANLTGPTATAVGAPLTGVVTGPDEQPIANAQVRAVRWAPDDWRIGEWHDQTAASARTDASGRFWLQVPRDTWQIEISAAGFARATAQYTGSLQGATVELLAELTDMLHVTGRVINENGQPVAGARVSSADCDLAGPRPATTDESGKFAIATEWNELWVFHPDYAITCVRGVEGDVTLARGGGLRVRVIRGGTPVSRALIGLRSEAREIAVALEAPENSGFKADRRVDDQGMVIYSNIPAGEGFVVKARTASGDAASVCRDVIVRAGQVTDCTVTLPHLYPGKVAGKVLYSDGQPAVGAYLTVRKEDSDDLDRVIPVGDDGSFEAGLDVGSVRVSAALAPGSGYLVEGDAQRTLEVTTGSPSFYEEFRLRRIEPTWISLVDSSGQPVTLAFVDIAAGFRAGRGVRLRVHTPDGRFSVVSAVHRVRAYNPETGLAGATAVVEGPRDMRVTLDTSVGAIAGRVVDGNGNPLARVEVYAAGPDTWATGELTDANGRFRIEPLVLDGVYSLLISNSGYQLRPGSQLDALRAAVAPQPLVVVMVPSDSGISGRVVALDGTPVAGARVTALDGKNRVAEATTDIEGAFGVSVAPGPYALSAYGMFVEGQIASVVAPARDVVLTLPVPAATAEQATPAPQGPMQEKICDNLKQMGLVCKMFANEHKSAEGIAHEAWPAMEPAPGAFYPEQKAVYPEYLANRSILSMIKGEGEVKLCYLGYAVTDESTALALLDAYEKLGPEAIYDQDIQVGQGHGTAGGDVIHRLRESVANVFVSDPADGQATAQVQADIPVMWQIPEEGENSGGWVLFMDGHVEWRPYPGGFPMTEPFIKRIKGLMHSENP